MKLTPLCDAPWHAMGCWSLFVRRTQRTTLLLVTGRTWQPSPMSPDVSINRHNCSNKCSRFGIGLTSLVRSGVSPTEQDPQHSRSSETTGFTWLICRSPLHHNLRPSPNTSSLAGLRKVTLTRSPCSDSYYFLMEGRQEGKQARAIRE